MAEKYEWKLTMEPGQKGGPGSGYHGHAGRPGQVGGSAPGRGMASTGREWDADTDNPEKYHPFVRGVYDGLPPSAKDGIPAPRVVIDETLGDPRMQFASIRMGLSGVEPNPRTGEVNHKARQRIGKVFVHEYAHYLDYHRQLSDEPEFNRVFQESVRRAGSMSESVSAVKKPQTKDEIRMAAEVLGGKVDWESYPEGYLGRGTNRQKELFAIGMAAWEYYSPAFWRELPELRGYFAKNFPHPGGD